MPSRLRNTAAADAAQSEPRYDIPGLQFNEPLSWRAGRAIPVGDLLTRLQKLAAKLRNYDLDQVDSRAFTTLAHDLANANLLAHKDKGVRAWTVSCVVDVLKICAPDAPFIEGQLKDIFTVIINSILPALSDPTNAYNAQHVYILSSLAESQSILLVTDISNHDNLIVSLFTTAFDIVSASGNNASGVEVSKSVEYHLKNLLSAVVDEVSLPQEVTDIIISQFLRVDARNIQDQGSKGKKRDAQDSKQGNLLLKDYPPAYNMAKSLCTTCPEKMTAHITQYFGTVIVDATASTSLNGASKGHHRRTSDVGDDDEERESLADLRKAHRLLRELWRACPDVLLNVIPQVEAEFNADSVPLRQLATETIGYITAGIGIAGVPPSQPLDPAAYPLPSIDQEDESQAQATNPLLAPASPKPFMAVHATAYQSFLSRQNDRSHLVREAWAKSAARILRTSAGGIGLNTEELESLLAGFAQTLRDPEEHVRLAAVKAMDIFAYHALINVLGADAGLAKRDTVFSSLADRVTDKKNNVREAAMELLARIWGAASRDIEQGNEVVKSVIGDIPNRLLGAYFTNEPHILAAIDRVLYESLLPLSFPPSKVQISRTDIQKQRAKDKEGSSQEEPVTDPDVIRARRILTLIQSLDARVRQVFFSMQFRQVRLSKGMRAFLDTCEEYNGGVVEDDASEATLRKRLTTMIDTISKTFSDSSEVSDDLWKFTKQHNRRWYQLIRFATGPENEYRTVVKAIKELIKRIHEGPANVQSLVDMIQPILYRCALLAYNRSHVPAIMEISRSDELGLGDAAHEVLKEISARNPEVLKHHIQALCKELEEEAPTVTKFEKEGAAATLKACAGYARKYPTDLPKERKFMTVLTQFALFSKSPRAAKHAVSIVMLVADKKEMYAKDLLSKALEDCQPDSPHFLARLATVAQLYLLAPATAQLEADAIDTLVAADILTKNHSPSRSDDENAWDEKPDDETQSKELALKILVNRARAIGDDADAKEFATTTKEAFRYLVTVIESRGEITSSKDTPPAQKNRLRLTAAHLVLKLCNHNKKCDDIIDAKTFNEVVLVVIQPPNPVRTGFVNSLKKYLGQNLTPRWFTCFFLLAFEPDMELRASTITWLRARKQVFKRRQLEVKEEKPVLEPIFARLLSLLAHHPDHPTQESDDGELLDFGKYIVFYVWCVSDPENLSLIFHYGQRVKGARDGVTGTDEASERLYVLSDLAQAVIRNYANIMPGHSKGASNLQTYPGKVTLPKALFRALPSHETAQDIAEKNYLPEDVAIGLEKMIRTYIKELKTGIQPPKRAPAAEKKRKSDAVGLDGDEDEPEKKKPTKGKAKRSTLAIRRTPQAKRKTSEAPSSPTLPSRKSVRTSKVMTYAESDTGDEGEVDDAQELASSPVVRRQAKKPEANEEDVDEAVEDKENDVDMGGEEQGIEDEVVVQEDEDAEAGVEDSAEEVKKSPPLKEKKNAAAKKGRGKGGGSKKTTPTKKTMPKQKAETPVRTTRQTRSAKA
ncbi:Sister chromatid cohesion protein pds5 [Cladophialophora chaetospira]|uniref:Sister chromatid cohesion protein pds5 n=1 Tax=Cladophialophora chaetospira TaxID=386627 RepID=A0AA39CER1_9EURO|nr:Sister chromatid cohesion protein pds5 [Cladophialophora chaetospira]